MDGSWGTIFFRTDSSNERLEGRVASTWGTQQQQSPPTASYIREEESAVSVLENGKTTTRTEKMQHSFMLPLQASHIQVRFHLDPRQKGLLWYSTYVVDFSADYSFLNNSESSQNVCFRLNFPAKQAVYDGLAMTVNGQTVPVTADEGGAVSQAPMGAGERATFHVSYRSQGLGSWRYKLADGIAQAHDFSLTMHTNFRNVDFADDTLSPTAKHPTPDGWDLDWRYSDLISGFQIGMTMPERLQPGPLAGNISYAAPVSLFFFFFLMFILTTLRNIDLHPMNYFFLATGFFAFHLLLAYLVDHISIHVAMVISSLVSVGLVVSYLRLVVGIRFAAGEALAAQLVYLVLFSYAFFWNGFTGISITVIAVITLFVVMQATGRIRWSEKFGARAEAGLPTPLRQNGD